MEKICREKFGLKSFNDEENQIEESNRKSIKKLNKEYLNNRKTNTDNKTKTPNFAHYRQKNLKQKGLFLCEFYFIQSW